MANGTPGTLEVRNSGYMVFQAVLTFYNNQPEYISQGSCYNGGVSFYRHVGAQSYNGTVTQDFYGTHMSGWFTDNSTHINYGWQADEARYAPPPTDCNGVYDIVANGTPGVLQVYSSGVNVFVATLQFYGNAPEQINQGSCSAGGVSFYRYVGAQSYNGQVTQDYYRKAMNGWFTDNSTHYNYSWSATQRR